MFIYSPPILILFFYLFDFYEPQLFGLSQYSSTSSQNKLDDLDPVEAIFLSQSSTCSESDHAMKVQCFRELPQPKYEVFEGEDLLMRCRVAYQKGKLQWAFKGKMLGFDRDIPNYPRMRMPGKAEIGDHSLFIENVKVSDSGNYECQLSPSASQPPRRRMTNLMVLRAPMNPVIYKEDVLLNQNLSVSIMKDQLGFFINLTCVAYEGNPGPIFEWSINGSKLESSAIFRFVRTSITMVNESANMISLRSDQVANNDIVTCRVYNAATEKRDKPSDRILQAQIRVVKRILPGSLRFKEMLPNIDTVIVKDKDHLKLTCIANEPGDPPVHLSWRSTLSKDAVTDRMIQNLKNPSFTQSTIVIPVVDSKWHRESLICGGTQDGIFATKDIRTTILVEHLPKKLDLAVVSMTSNHTLENPSVIFYRYNQMAKLVCSTNTFYAQNLKIVWMLKDSEESNWRKVTQSNENVIDMDDGRLKILRSVLEISPGLFNRNNARKDSSKFILGVLCMMRFQDSGIELRKEVKFEGFERPSNPIITINDERKSPVLSSENSAKIKCSISGGHPTPDLHLVDEKNRDIVGRKSRNFGVNILEYRIEVKHQDNGKRFRCITSSKDILDFVSLSSEFISLSVAIPPQKLTIKHPDPKFGYRAHDSISYECATDSSFPKAKIEWLWYHSCKIQSLNLARQARLSSTDIRPFCETEVLEEIEVSKFTSATQSTKSTIKITLLPSHDQTFIECFVSPNPQWGTFRKELSQISQIRVQYLPQFPLQLEKSYTVEEGQNLSISLNASANPTINGYTWLLNQLPITRKSQIDLKVDQFVVTNAQYDMMGNYTMMLENPIGKAEITFFLNITFAPKLLGPSLETIKVNKLKEYRQKATIMCSAQANPFGDQVKIQWVREASLISDQRDLVNSLKGHSLFSVSPFVHCAKDQWSKGNVSINCISLGSIEVVSSLQVTAIDHRYIGSYKCIFSSSIKPSSASKTTNMVFPTKPIPVKNARKSEYALKIGGKTEIACYFVAFPKPSITWTRAPNFRCSDNSKKYATSISTPQIGLIKAVLAIRETNESDIGAYNCIAKNQYGISTHSVTLDRPRVPTQPMNVTLVNVTDTSITLGWIPGFNGGSKQTIELRWRPYDIGREGDYSFMEFVENEDSDIQFYTIIDLQNHKEYEILIQATNRYTINPENPVQVFVKTMKYESEGEFVQSDGRKNIFNGNKGKRVQDRTDTNNILIIILLSTVGGLLIGLKIGLVIYFVRKRNLKSRKSLDKLSSPVSQRMTDGYLNSAESMEMRAPSLIRSGIESNMYAQSISDHMSQNGSDNGLKLNYYKTPSDELQYLSPELDLVASAMGRTNYNTSGIPSNFHPAYVQLAESSSLTGYPEQYLTGYYTHKPLYHGQTPANLIPKNTNHSTIVTTNLPQYPISSNYQKRVEINNYPSSAVSISTASGESNRSRSPHTKYTGYSPLIGQSGAPSTVEEYLSSANSGSEYHRFAQHGNEDHLTTPMTSFTLSQNDYYNGLAQEKAPAQESILEIPCHKMRFDNGMDFHYPMLEDRLHLSTCSEHEQLLKPPVGFSGSNTSMGQQKACELSKINYVDLISHSSPSVIRITGTISEDL